MFALLTTFMLAAVAPTQPTSRSESPRVPQDIIEALYGYRKSIHNHCVSQEGSEQHDAIADMIQRRPEFGRDLAAMRSHYNDTFTEPVATMVTASPPFCRTPEEFKENEDSERSALDRLTRMLVEHGVLPIS